MPRHEQIRCRYAHCDDDVPDGWEVYPLGGWHGAKGYVLWSEYMTNGRAKGAQFEREVVNVFRDWLGDEATQGLRRNLTQYQVADEGDLKLGPFLIECKRYAKGDIHQQWWWEQILKAAGEKYIPLLIYRFDRRPIRMVFPLHVVGDYPENHDYTCTVGLEEGIMIIRERLLADS